MTTLPIIAALCFFQFDILKFFSFRHHRFGILTKTITVTLHEEHQQA